MFPRWLLWTFAAIAWLCLIGAVRAETLRGPQGWLCKASFYGYESGRTTASGERFRPSGFTAAHRTLPFGSRLHVSLGARSVVVRVNDRGPAAWTGRCLDLSQGAAAALGLTRAGVATVRIARLN